MHAIDHGLSSSLAAHKHNILLVIVIIPRECKRLKEYSIYPSTQALENVGVLNISTIHHSAGFSKGPIPHCEVNCNHRWAIIICLKLLGE